MADPVRRWSSGDVRDRVPGRSERRRGGPRLPARGSRCHSVTVPGAAVVVMVDLDLGLGAAVWGPRRARERPAPGRQARVRAGVWGAPAPVVAVAAPGIGLRMRPSHVDAQRDGGRPVAAPADGMLIAAAEAIATRAAPVAAARLNRVVDIGFRAFLLVAEDLRWSFSQLAERESSSAPRSRTRRQANAMASAVLGGAARAAGRRRRLAGHTRRSREPVDCYCRVPCSAAGNFLVLRPWQCLQAPESRLPYRTSIHAPQCSNI